MFVRPADLGESVTPHGVTDVRRRGRRLHDRVVRALFNVLPLSHSAPTTTLTAQTTNITATAISNNRDRVDEAVQGVRNEISTSIKKAGEAVKKVADAAKNAADDSAQKDAA